MSLISFYDSYFSLQSKKTRLIQSRAPLLQDFPLSFIDIILIWLSSDTESAEAAEGAKDEKDAEEVDANNKEKVDEEAAINNNNTKKSVTARFTITCT